MIDKHLLDELGDRVSEAMRRSPAQDLEKNLRALLAAFFDRFDLVAREDFEVQKKLLERAQAKLAANRGARAGRQDPEAQEDVNANAPVGVAPVGATPGTGGFHAACGRRQPCAVRH